jgi:hypothetical protein
VVVGPPGFGVKVVKRVLYNDVATVSSDKSSDPVLEFLHFILGVF